MEVGTASIRSFDHSPNTPSFFHNVIPATGDAWSETREHDEFSSAVDVAPEGCVRLETAEHGATSLEAFASTENDGRSSGGSGGCENIEQELNGILSTEKTEFATVGPPICERFESKAAVKVQKVYKSYRTRRRLADSAVVAEELWWQAIDYVRLNHSTVSFFNYLKPESAASRWNRVSLNASKVGKGLSRDSKALKLAFQHWIEAIDPRHRYGHNLHIYYEEWCTSDAGQPFFYWLDIGDGRNVDLVECPRSLLREQCITYLGPKEREHYEYVLIAGKIIHKKTGELLDTTKGSEKAKWIFVMSTSKKLYAGQKKKGKFHHSSFLAGGVTIAAGRLIAEEGVLKSIWAYSGHYRPTEENLNNFLTFLGENGLRLDTVQIHSSSTEDYYEETKQVQEEQIVEDSEASELPKLEIPTKRVADLQSEDTPIPKNDSAEVEVRGIYQRTLSGGLQSPRAEVPQNAILKRIKSKGQTSSYQLGHQLSLRWTTGAGPRIGCIADYPMELRMQALEFVNLSPRVSTPSAFQ